MKKRAFILFLIILLFSIFTFAQGKISGDVSLNIKEETISAKLKYQYFALSENRADYWIYALVPCQIKGGKEDDLLFYTGDDTNDKTVILENKGTFFKVFSRKEKTY